MKANIVRGAGFGGLLLYIFDEANHGHSLKNPQIMSTNMSGETIDDLTREFEAVSRLNPGIGKPVWHCSLSLVPGEKLTKEKWDIVIRDFLNEMGIDADNHQYVAVLHNDTEHQHVHIALNRVGLNAKVWAGKWELFEAIKATQVLELRHGLIVTDGLHHGDKDHDNDNSVWSKGERDEKKRTGKDPKKIRLAALIKASRNASKTFPAFVDALAAAGVTLAPNGLTGVVSGASFSFEGTSYTGGSLHKTLSWKHLSAAVNFDPVADAPLIAKLRVDYQEQKTKLETESEVKTYKRNFEEVMDAALADLYDKKSVIPMSDIDIVLQDIGTLMPDHVERASAELRSQIEELGRDRTGIPVYTSTRILERELRMITGARVLAGDTHHDLTLSEVQNAIDTKEIEASGKAGRPVRLSEEQCAAIRYGAKGGLVIIQGSAGAGKSFSMEVMRLAYEERGYQVLGCATARLGAQNLENEAGIKSYTIAMLLNEVKARRTVIDRKTCLVVDEAGQVGSGNMADLVAICERAGAKLVLTGEDLQTDAIQHGGALRLLSKPEVVGTARIQAIQRQNEQWTRTAVENLRDGKMSEGHAAFEERGLVHWVKGGRGETMAALIKDWHVFELVNPSKQAMILAHSNKDARALGTMVRDIRIQEGHVTGPEYTMRGTHSAKSYDLVLAQGDRVRFGFNDEAGIGAINGTLGMILAIKPVAGEGGEPDLQLTVQTDDRGVIEFRKSEYCDEKGDIHMAQAYALTIFSSQGQSVKGDTFKYQSSGMGRALEYVASSRAKDRTHTYIDQDALEYEARTSDPRELRNALIDNMSSDQSAPLATEILMANDDGYFERTYPATDAAARQARDIEMAEDLEEEDLPAPIETYEAAIEAVETDLFGMESAVTLDRFDEAVQELEARAPQYLERVRIHLKERLSECGVDEGGRPVYTTSAILNREHRMIRDVRTLANDRHHDLSDEKIYAAIAQKEQEVWRKSKLFVAMTSEQRAGVTHTLHGGYASLQGSAGSGKSFGMEVVKIAYQNEGYRVFGAAVGRKASKGLEAETGIESFTIAKLLKNIKRRHLVLDHKTCLIVDEAGQVGTGYLAQLAYECRAAGAKLVLTGEDRQIDAIQHGGVLRFLSRDDMQGTARIQTILRQKEEWSKEAIGDLRDGRIEKGFSAYEAHGLIHWKRGGAEATQDALIKAWAGFEAKEKSAVAEDPNHKQKQSLIIAHSNVSARELGDKVRNIRKEDGTITGPDYVLQACHGDRNYKLTLARGDRVRFNKNNEQGVGVVNGTLGTIMSIIPIIDEAGKADCMMKVQTDDLGEVEFKASDYCDEKGRIHMGQAYAMTIYSSQGVTIKGNVYQYWTPGITRADYYVGNSRAVYDTHTFFDRDAVQAMARSADDAVLRAYAIKCISRDNGKKMATEHMVLKDPDYIGKTFGADVLDENRRHLYSGVRVQETADDLVRARFAQEEYDIRHATFDVVEGKDGLHREVKAPLPRPSGVDLAPTASRKSTRANKR